MATVFAACRSAPRPSITPHLPPLFRPLWRARTIHNSPVVLKKPQKQKQKPVAPEMDDLFGESDEHADSLFPSSSRDLLSERDTTALKPRSAPSFAPGSQTQHRRNPSVPPSPDVGLEKRFEEVYHFLHVCLVDKTDKQRVPRSTVWLNLINVAANRQQLERLAQLLPKWRDAKRLFHPHTADHLAKRCQRLRCPELALKVFSDHPQYGLDLTLDAARVTLHGLQTLRPVQECITFTSLFSVYNLPPVSSDLLCATMLLRALFKDESEESLIIARTMVPSFQALLSKANPQTFSLQNKAQRPLGQTDKKWLAWTLMNLQNCFDKHGVEHSWLQHWMEASGYAAFTAKATGPPQ